MEGNRPTDFRLGVMSATTLNMALLKCERPLVGGVEMSGLPP